MQGTSKLDYIPSNMYVSTAIKTTGSKQVETLTKRDITSIQREYYDLSGEINIMIFGCRIVITEIQAGH